MSKKLNSIIDFKPTNAESFDCEKNNRYVLDEVGLWPPPDPNFNYQDFIKDAKAKRKKIGLKFAKSKKKNK